MATDEMATVAPGNTRAGANIKAKNFQLTLNEVEKFDELTAYLTSLKSTTYIIACKELAPTTGHEHIHIYCQFSNAIKLSLKKCCGAHVEYCRGTPQQNVDYIKKDGNIIYEFGTLRRWGGIPKIGEIKKMTTDEINELPANYQRVAKEIKREQDEMETFEKMLDEIDNDALVHPDIIYITGDSGSGKTYQAYKFALQMYAKEKIGKITIENNYFAFTNPNAECFVIEEFRPSDCRASLFLQLTDAYGFNAPIKGGFQYVRAKCIIICSIIPSREIYKNDEINQQFQRRIKFEFDKTIEEPPL